jgi:hypothetical protein
VFCGNDILGGLAVRIPVFLRNGEKFQNRDTQMWDFIVERGKGASRVVKIC